jgi:hypothetical protein
VEHIPCEAIYINVKLKIENMDTIVINDIHKILYDPQKKIGWQTLLIYNIEGKYVSSHSSHNMFYYQSGD